MRSLPLDVAVDVDDLLDPIPANDLYTHLKNAVIQRVAKSASLMLQELFMQVELGGQTPSQLMRHMRLLLAGRHMDDAIFRQIWLDKLPVPMQQVLAMLDISVSLDKMANHADRISLTTGKRPRQPVTATAAAGQSRPSRLIYINDKSSGLRFLVDTGAEVSVIPPPRRHHLKPSQFSLQTANSTTINTYGQRSLTFDIGLRRRFQLVFVQADVKSPITGADFLTHFGLAVDLKHRKLFDTATTLFTLRRFIGLLNYYRRFILHCAATLAPITDLLKSKAKPIELSPAAHSAFRAAKKGLADATLLHHLSSDPHAQLILATDASNSAVGAVLHQQVNNQLQPLAFFSQKLQPAQTHHSTFSQGRDVSVHTDHKPLTYAKPDRYSLREVRHLDFISQFTADIRYVRGSDNVVADALSRADINTLTSDLDLAKLVDLQSGDKSIDDLRSTTTLQLRDAPLPASPGTNLCDWSTGIPRPVVPLSYRKTVFDHFHFLSHPGIRAFRRLIAARFT
ncbi:hypothetical protein SprV_0200801700 [Sparganum proliferum]